MEKSKRLLSFLFLIFISCAIFSHSYSNSVKSKNLWTKYDNELIQKINTNLKSYQANASSIREELIDIMENDLHYLKNVGITYDAVQNATTYGTKYQLINHTLYRDRDCFFPARCSGIEYFLSKHLDLENYEIIVNTRDYPQISTFSNLRIPVFSFSKTSNFLDIMYPAWSFWSGGPAIKSHPTGIGRWDKMRLNLMDAAKKWPWNKKKSKGFFRGSRTSSERDELIYLSREHSDILDASYTKNQAWKSKADTLNADPASEVRLEEHCRYKYLFNFRGVAASFRFKHLFLCKSLVLHVGEEWMEFFYPILKPWVHYIPIRSDYKRQDIMNILTFFREHEDLAETIADNGFKLISEHLKLGKVKWYWRRLLKRYIQLQKFSPVLEHALMKINS